MNILIVTPVPTYPATQGSRQRVADMARAFQRRGDNVTMLYWTGERPEAGSIEAMTAAWDGLRVVPDDRHVQRRSQESYFDIDDWYHDAIDRALSALLRDRRFDACVVNYVWLSRALLMLPPDCVRVIDLHDLFGDRAARFAEIGQGPDWYHTSIAQEQRGLDRADLLVAIQAEEAQEARRRTTRAMVEVGLLSRPWPVRARTGDGPLTVGYLGSPNAFNVASIRAFIDALAANPLPTVRLVAAGPICDLLAGMERQPFALLGRVRAPADFYAGVDVAINPMLGGTGLKIKTVEALAHGVGVVATPVAFAGIETDCTDHLCGDVGAMIERLHRLADDPSALASLRQASRRVFARYAATQSAHFDALHDRITALRAERLTAIPSI